MDYTKREKRKKRISSKIYGTKTRPRLSVFRSGRFIYAQIINDMEGKTVISASDRKARADMKRMEKAKAVGVEIAEKAKKRKITQIVFDRGGYKYHGRVRALAEGAREGGLKF